MNRRTLNAATALLAIGVAMPPTVLAYETLGMGPYANNTFTYRINDTSFSTNLRSQAMTTAQARHWVRWSLAQWQGMSGSGLVTNETGTTTLGDTNSECQYRVQGIDYSFIGATNGCWTVDECRQFCRVDPDCPITGAITFPFQDASGQLGILEQSQVCIMGQAHDWEVDADGFEEWEIDLVGVLTHELGHALGLDHPVLMTDPSGVMKFDAQGYGNTLARVPYGDDIEGLRSIFGQGSNRIKVGIYDDNGGFTWVTTPGTFAHQRYGATITETAAGNSYVIHAGPSPTGTSMHFRRTPYPVTANSTWTNRSTSHNAWAPPRMVSNQDKTVAVWPNTTRYVENCGEIVVAYTSNAFDLTSYYQLNDSCTRHPVSIAYDPVTDLYVMAYLRHSMDPAKNNRIMFRVSTDALLWEDPIDSTIRSSLAPSVACSDGECVLTYNHRGIDGYPFHREIELGPVSLNVSVSSTTTSFAARNLTPPSAAGRTHSSDIMLMWSNQGATDIRFEPATTVPVTFDDQYWVATTARYGGEIAVFSDVPNTNYKPHIFYTVP